jgi:hypothetical protein
MEMRDSRLGDLIGYSERFLPEFIDSQGSREKLSWLNEAVVQWKDECRLPPGCKTIQLDAWLSSPERIQQLSEFFGFLAEKIRATMPSTEAVMATEAEKVRKFILETCEKK